MSFKSFNMGRPMIFNNFMLPLSDVALMCLVTTHLNLCDMMLIMTSLCAK